MRNVSTACVLVFLAAGCTSTPPGECPDGFTMNDAGLCLEAADTAADTGAGDTAETDSGGDDSTDTDTDSGQETGADTADTGDTDTGDTGDTGTEHEYTVCNDGVAPYDDLQDAVDDADDGDVIYVCPGTWERIELDRADIRIVGDDPETTIIDGDRKTAIYAVDSTLALEGLTLTGGAEGTSDETNAGALFLGYSTFTGSDLVIRDCTTTLVGFAVEEKETDSVWEDVRFEDNVMNNAFISVNNGTVFMRHVVVTGTQPTANGYGGNALYIEGTSFEISNVLIYGNKGGGGVDIVDLRQVTGDGWFYNSVIYDNETTGEAVVAGGSTTLLENLIVSDNAEGAGVATYSGAVVQYTDAYGNKSNFTNDATSQPNNLSSNPRFTDAPAGDFTLDPGFSPAIDQGNPLAGYNDIDGTRNDLGIFGGPSGDWVP